MLPSAVLPALRGAAGAGLRLGILSPDPQTTVQEVSKLSPDAENTLAIPVPSLPCNAVPLPWVGGRLKLPPLPRKQQSPREERIDSHALQLLVTWDSAVRVKLHCVIFPGERPRLYTQEFPVSVTISSYVDSGWAARGDGKTKLAFFPLSPVRIWVSVLSTYTGSCRCWLKSVPGRRGFSPAPCHHS